MTYSSAYVPVGGVLHIPHCLPGDEKHLKPMLSPEGAAHHSPGQRPISVNLKTRGLPEPRSGARK